MGCQLNMGWLLALTLFTVATSLLHLESTVSSSPEVTKWSLSYNGKVVAGLFNQSVYISTDFGKTFDVKFNSTYWGYVAVSGDGKTIAIINVDMKIDVYKFTNVWALKFSIPGPTVQSLTSLTLNFDGTRLVQLAVVQSVQTSTFFSLDATSLIANFATQMPRASFESTLERFAYIADGSYHLGTIDWAKKIVTTQNLAPIDSSFTYVQLATNNLTVLSSSSNYHIWNISDVGTAPRALGEFGLSPGYSLLTPDGRYFMLHSLGKMYKFYVDYTGATPVQRVDFVDFQYHDSIQFGQDGLSMMYNYNKTLYTGRLTSDGAEGSVCDELNPCASTKCNKGRYCYAEGTKAEIPSIRISVGKGLYSLSTYSNYTSSRTCEQVGSTSLGVYDPFTKVYNNTIVEMSDDSSPEWSIVWVPTPSASITSVWKGEKYNIVFRITTKCTDSNYNGVEVRPYGDVRKTTKITHNSSKTLSFVVAVIALALSISL